MGTVLPILQYPNPLLHEISHRAEVCNAVRTLLDDMTETMYASGGIGLAAPQVGVLLRVVVIDIGEGLIELINPVIMVKEGDVRDFVEGCLSVGRGAAAAAVERAAVVDVQATDRTGRTFKIGGTGVLAIALQHEIDHLDGILFIDRLGEKARKRFLAQLVRGF